MSDSGIEIANVTRKFGVVTALDAVSLEIRRGEFFSLLGPSGCGKTTLLRIIAGLEHPDAGELRVAGRSMRDVPPQQRPVNTVFQNYALFPHLSVFDNVAFGLRMRRTPQTELLERVKRVLALVHVTDLAERFPNQISGGQKQRVALARALVNEPQVLLLDEPLAAIDARLRTQLQSELKTLQRQLGTTFVYVTHDQDEALSLSDRIAVMQSGWIEQFGPPKEVYERPASRFVASFVGACNLFEGRIRSENIVETKLGPLRLSSGKIANPDVSLGIRRENILINVDCPVRENSIRGLVEDVSFNGAQTILAVLVNGVRLYASKQSTPSDPQPGESVDVKLPAESILLFEK